VDRGGVVHRKHVGAHVHGKHQLGTAEHDRLDLLLGKLGDQRLQLPLAVAHHPSGGQLLEDDPVDLADPLGRDRREGYAAAFEAAAHVPLGHGEARSEQRDLGAAVGKQPVAGGVRDVQHGNGDVGGHGVIDLVAGVGGDDDPFRTRGLEPPGRLERDVRDAVPVAGKLHPRDGLQVEAFDAQNRAVQPAEPARHRAVDMFVVKRGRRPARAADDPQLAHDPSLQPPTGDRLGA
jgi:hypothetical protein